MNQDLFQNKHIFDNNGRGRCQRVINDYIGECGCVKENDVHIQFVDSRRVMTLRNISNQL